MRNINNDHNGKGCQFFLNSLMLKEVLNTFITTTGSFANCKRVGLCPMRNEGKSVSSIFYKGKTMNTETETAPPAAWISGEGGDARTIRGCKTTSESSSSNGSRGQGRDGCGGRCVHQGRGGQGGHFNHPAYIKSILNLKGEVEDFGMILGTAAEQRESKGQYK